MDQHQRPASPNGTSVGRPSSSRSTKPGGNWKALKKSLETNTSSSTMPHKRRRKSGDKNSHHDANTRPIAGTMGYHGVGATLNAISVDIKGKARALDPGVIPPGTAGPDSSSASPLPWFAEDLSPEDLALVKGFSSSPGNGTARTTWIHPSSGGTVEEDRRKKQIILGGHWGGDSQAKKEPGQFVAIDCEMVGVGYKGSESVLARVSIVNWHGHVLLDRFVKPMERVTDYRTWVSGIRAKDLQGAPSFKEVQAEVAALVKGRVLVGHAIQNDLQALLLSHPRPLVRDTSTFQPLRTIAQTKFPSLRKLAQLVLGIEIQKAGEEHSSVEDARTTMAIFRTQKEAWEKSLRESGKSHKKKTSSSSKDDEGEGRVGATSVSQPALSKAAMREGQANVRAVEKSVQGSGRATSRGGRKQEAAPGWWKDEP